MNEDNENTTAAVETTEQPTVEIPEAPAETTEAKPPEIKTEEPPKAAKDAPKPERLGDNPLYKALRRNEAKVEQLTKLVTAMAKNSGNLSEEDQQKLDNTEKEAATAAAAARMDTLVSIAEMAGRAGTNRNDPRLAEAAKLWNAGDYEAAIESATNALEKEIKPVTTPEDIEKEVERRLKEERRKNMTFDSGLPSGGRGYTDKQIAEMPDEKWAKERDEAWSNFRLPKQ